MALGILVFLILLPALRGQQLLAVQPTQAVVTAGQHLELTCMSLSSHPQMKWTLTHIEDGTLDIIADGLSAVQNEGPGGKFSVSMTETESNVQSVLRIQGISLKEGGVFQCEDLSQPNVTPKRSSVVVLGAEPMCAMTPDVIAEGDVVTFNCQIHVAGQWRPVMEWTGPDGVIPGSELILDHQKDLVRISYQLTANRSMDGQTFSCRMFFKDPEKDPLPYSFLHHFPTLDILYPSSNISVSPMKDVYNPGDHVTCTADGKPSPTLEWRDDESINRCRGATLVITERMEGHKSFSCVATSFIRERAFQARKTLNLFVHSSLGSASLDLEDLPDGACVMGSSRTTPSSTEPPTVSSKADSLGAEEDEGTLSRALLVPVAICAVLSLVAIISIACYCTTKRLKKKRSLEMQQNLNNDVYLRTCADNRVGGFARPNQYATAFGVHDMETGAFGGHQEKKGDESDDDSSGFYSELIVPEEQSSKGQPEPPAPRMSSVEASMLSEDGYLMPVNS